MKPLGFSTDALAPLALSTALCSVIPAAAQELSSDLPLWEVGGFGVGVSQQAYPGSDQQIKRGLALPYLVYRGEFLRADRETAGLRALKTQDFELDVGVAGSFGAGSDDIEARRGMPKLGTLVEFGPRLKWDFSDSPSAAAWRLELPLRGVFDLSDRAKYRGLAFEPRLVFQRRANAGWSYMTSVSAIVADQRLAHTFYGVDPIYASVNRPSYAAKSGLVAWRLSASFSRSLSQNWRLFGFGRIDTVNGAANEQSPLIKRTHGASVGVGLAYTWLRSGRSAIN